MAISLSGFKVASQKKKVAEEIAAAQARAAKKQRKRKGFSKFLGGIGGKIVGTLAAGLVGPLAAPLVAGLANWGTKKLVDEGTKAVGMGASKSDIAAIKGDQYGFGKEEAAKGREELKEGRKTDWKDTEGLVSDIAGAATGAIAGGKYLEKFAGKGKLGELVTKGKKMYDQGASRLGLGGGDKGVLGDTITDTAKSVAGGGDQTFGQAFAAARKAHAAATGGSGQGGMFEFDGNQFSTNIAEEGLFEEGGMVQAYEGGGEVDVATLSDHLASKIPPPLSGDELLKFVRMQAPKQEKSNTPTITEYFGKKGRTLGGGRNKSISELLGR